MEESRNINLNTGTNLLDYVPIVGQGLSGLMEALRGGAKRRRRREIYNMLLGELGRPAMTNTDIQGIMESIRRTMGPHVAGTAQSASERLGLDSGAAQGELARAMLTPQYEALGQLNLEKVRMNNQKRLAMLRALTEVGIY
ncbi:MAG: hypothetical protein ACFFCW_01780 [Candidatus Hodarchaeota archaeon]